MRSSMMHFLPLNLPACHFIYTEEMEGKIAQVIEMIKPKAVICGTTRHPSPDREFLYYARLFNVRSVAVLDEWYLYRCRFYSDSEIQSMNFPDVIALPDGRALCEAINEGLPSDRCHATGSPSLSRLWELGEMWRKHPPPVPSVVGEGITLTFISETHAEDYGRTPGDSGLMGDYIGYTELTVRDSILDVLAGLDKKITFIEKKHPAAKDVLPPGNIPANVDYRVAGDVDTWELCVHSDLVIGMRSMALLEAHLLGCTVVSYQPGLVDDERCAAVRLGLVPGLREPDELINWIEGVVHTPNNSPHLERPWFARADAASRIVDLSLGVASA